MITTNRKAYDRTKNTSKQARRLSKTTVYPN